MKSDQLTFRTGFRISIGNGRSQAAEMVLTAGRKGRRNRYQGDDQWLLEPSPQQGAIAGVSSAARNAA